MAHSAVVVVEVVGFADDRLGAQWSADSVGVTGSCEVALE